MMVRIGTKYVCVDADLPSSTSTASQRKMLLPTTVTGGPCLVPSALACHCGTLA